MTSPILIVGATGAVGRGLVAAAVAARRPVIATARNPHRLEALRAAHPRADLTLLPGSVAVDARAARLVESIQALGRPLGGVMVAVRGEARRGRLVEQPAAALRRTLDRNLQPHLVAARHLLPLLSTGGRGGGYVLVGGPGGDSPWAGYGTYSIAASALQMLARVLHDEARTHEVRVQLLLVGRPVCPDDTSVPACPEWPTAIEIGRRALELIDRVDCGAAASPVVAFPSRVELAARRASTAAPADATAADERCQLDVRGLLQRLLPQPPHKESP